MYTREQASHLRHEFWTTFGKYMSPVPSAEGLRINWINYHTRVRDVYFRMDAGTKEAVIAITLEHRDAGIRELYFEQFLELKDLLHNTLEEEWNWEKQVILPDGREISRIGKTLSGASIFNKDQWPNLISFFKPRIIALDSFWENARWSFEELR
ncbi:MAG: DUF4268 domain-containing protein [Cyclobacteriaceae bacterium]